MPTPLPNSNDPEEITKWFEKYWDSLFESNTYPHAKPITKILAAVGLVNAPQPLTIVGLQKIKGSDKFEILEVISISLSALQEIT